MGDKSKYEQWDYQGGVKITPTTLALYRKYHPQVWKQMLRHSFVESIKVRQSGTCDYPGKWA